MDPRCLLVPLENSQGTKPRKLISFRGWSKRFRSPISATIVMAVRKSTPRSDINGLTTGNQRQLSDSCRIAVFRRSSRSPAACTASRYSVKAIRWAGISNLISARNFRCFNVHAFPPRYGFPNRNSSACNCCLAAFCALNASSRARIKSRIASSAGSGTQTLTNSAERCIRASSKASRRSVLMRSAARRGTRDGATTMHSYPLLVSSLCRP